MSQLFDRSQHAVKLAFLRQEVPDAARSSAPRNSAAPVKSFRHGGDKWQVDAVTFLHKRGITLPIRRLMTEESYNNYVRRHGQPTELL